MAFLIGQNVPANGGGDAIGAGGAVASQFVAVDSGTVDTLYFYPNGGSGTSLWLGMFNDSANAPGSFIAEGQKASNWTTNAWNSVTGLSIPVVAGTKYWIAMCPIGGAANFDDGTEGKPSAYIASGLTSLSGASGWTTGGNAGYWSLYGTGDLSAPVLGPSLIQVTAPRLV